MPGSLQGLAARVRLQVDRRLPDKQVRRTVRGVPMVLPRRHLLPHITKGNSPYAVNLVQLVAKLNAAEGSVTVLDVGANVGDTALLILGETPSASIVCVEPDPVWLEYLTINTQSLPNVAVEASVLLADAASDVESLTMVHHEVGTSQVERDGEGDRVSGISMAELVRRHPQLADARLLKSDTDGWDIALVPVMASALAESRPVLFFEFDPRPTALTTPDIDPDDLWPQLIDLGYEDALVWDNGGWVLGASPVSDLAERSAVLKQPQSVRGYGFWDVAVAHRDDAVGQAVLADLAAGKQLN
jgi:FkbM family methyltransferase